MPSVVCILKKGGFEITGHLNLNTNNYIKIILWIIIFRNVFTYSCSGAIVVVALRIVATVVVVILLLFQLQPIVDIADFGITLDTSVT